MTWLKKALTEGFEPDRKDASFEAFAIGTIANPKLTSLQKIKILTDMVSIADTDYQREVAKTFASFAQSMVQADKPIDPETISKALTMLSSASALLQIAEKKRKQR